MASTTNKKTSIDDATPAQWDKARKEYLKSIENHGETYKPNLDDIRSMVWGDADVRAEWADNIRPDPVNNPSHYNQGGIECIDYIEQQLGDEHRGYLQGNVIKYLHRYKYKNGLEDLKKAQWYLERLIEHES